MTEKMKAPEEQKPLEQSDQMRAKELGSEICDYAKKISPESNKDGEIDGLSKDYDAKIDDIEKQFWNTNDKKKQEALYKATNEYVSKVRTIVGTTEGSQDKLVEDGKKANDKVDETNAKGTKDWKESMRKFSQELQERAVKKQAEQLQKAQKKWSVAHEKWNHEQMKAQASAQTLKTGPTDLFPA